MMNSLASRIEGIQAQTAKASKSRRLTKGNVRVLALSAIGIAAFVVWLQLFIVPVVFPRALSSAYPSCFFSLVALAAVGVARFAYSRSFPIQVVIVAVALCAVLGGVYVLVDNQGTPLHALLFLECLGAAVVTCAWMDKAFDDGNGVASPALLSGVCLAVIACLAMEKAGVVDIAMGLAAFPLHVASSAGIAALAIGLPVLTGAMLAVGRAPDADAPQAEDGQAAADDVVGPLGVRFPWMQLAALVVCCVISSVFAGMNTNPFIINSQTLALGVMGVSGLVALVLFAVSWIDARPSFEVLLAGAILCLCVGLLMYGTGLWGFMFSLGLVCLSGFLLRLFLPLLFLTTIESGSRQVAVPSFMLASALCLSAVGEQMGIWGVSLEHLGITQIAHAGLVVLPVAVVVLIVMLVFENVQNKRETNVVVEEALSATAVALQESERARSVADVANALAAEKVRAAKVAVLAAEEAQRVAEEKTRAAEEAMIAAEEAKNAAEEAKNAAEEARLAADQASVEARVVEVAFETNDEDERRLVELFEEHGLSAREVDVMKLVAKRFPNSAIAQKLFISERTVKFHITNSYRKLGVHSRSELVLAIDEYMNGSEFPTNSPDSQ